MITRGSKFFYAAAVVGFVTAIVYGFLTGAAAHSGVIGVFQDGDVVNSIVGPLTFGDLGDGLERGRIEHLAPLAVGARTKRAVDEVLACAEPLCGRGGRRARVRAHERASPAPSPWPWR